MRPACLPPITHAILLVTPFWAGVGYVVNGWLGVGITLVALGGLQLAILIVGRPPRLRVISEERIGTYDRRGRLRLTRAEWRKQVAWRARKRAAA